MLLIEALNIKQGGGLTLLSYLIERLNNQKVIFTAIVNDNCKILANTPNTLLIKSTLLNRDLILRDYYKKLQPATILCFGNLPPLFTLHESRVVTYFQNAHLLALGVKGYVSFRSKLRYRILMSFIKQFSKNSDFFCFQTSWILQTFIKRFGYDESHTHIYPFFDLRQIERLQEIYLDVKKEKGTFIYVSSNANHKNHKTLIQAWLILKKEFNLSPKLYLTIPKDDNHLTGLIKSVNEQGARIFNLGIIPYHEILKNIQKSAFTIFPSTLETIGLGLVEGCLLGNKILAANLPYVKEVVHPSSLFNPFDEHSIAKTVKESIVHENCLASPQLIIENKIDEFISFLIK